ncbi:MAG: hypothetical protein FWF44_05745 [Defluviitaleaceae bacterium]|nr:hypothetical protein [Defluviitaleaceae bacterium]
MFKCKPDYEEAQKNLDLFWENEDAGRPMVYMTYQKPEWKPFPKKDYPNLEARWLDLEYRVEEAAYWMENTVFVGEAMPVLFPNLGPEVFSAWAGCPYQYGEDTTWTSPCVFDWEKDGDKAVVDPNHPLYKKLEEYTSLALKRAEGSFMVGLTDFHPGGDHIAALRDPQTLATDLLEYPEFVKAKLKSSNVEYFAAFDHFLHMLQKAETPVASWLPVTARESMYIPSNDFSCMISTKMYEEFFYDGIRDECRHYGRSIYHLDGPGALRHLDAICTIPELNAFQWVPGAGREQVAPWIGVFKRMLAAGKSIMAFPQNMDDLRVLMDNLPSKGVYIQTWPLKNAEEAADLMKLIEGWPRGNKVK